MKKSMSIVLAAIMVILVVFASGCAPAQSSGGGTAASGGGSAAAEGTLQSMINPNDTYVVVGCIDSIEYWNAHRFGWRMAGQLYGVNTEWQAINGDDTTEMATLFDTVAAKNPNGIVVLGWDEGLAPSINRAVANGIPVVTFSGDVETSNRDTWVGSDQHDLGFIGGTKYADSIGGQGKVAILTYPGKGLFDGRQAGFEDAFSNYPGITVVAIGNTQTDEAIAVQAAKDILAAHPDLTGFVCCDATGPMGAATAIEEAGLVGKVDVLGLDRDTAMLERIKEGTITGSIVQDDVTMLFWGMTVLISANYYGDALLTTDNAAAGAKLTPNKISCAINYIDASNVDYYLAANKIFLE